MFHRYHDIKTGPEQDMIHNSSRSSTPSTPLDGRAMFSHSPSMQQSPPPVSYQNVSSPSSSLIHNMMFQSPKFISAGPPEAHSRYVTDATHRLAEQLEQSRYGVVNNSPDQYKISTDYQRLPTELPRLRTDYARTDFSRTELSRTDFPRMEDTGALDPYSRPSGDPYRTSDLHHRVQEASFQQLASSAHRLVSDLQRLQDSRFDPLRPLANETRSSDLSYRSLMLSDQHRVLSPEPPLRADTLRTHIDAQRMVTESLKDYFSNNPRGSLVLDAQRCSPDHLMGDDRKYAPEEIRYEMADLNYYHRIYSDNHREESTTPHSLLTDNLHPEPPPSMVPENLCLSSPGHHQLMPENLRVNVLPTSESPLPLMRSHYEQQPQSMMVQSPHMRVESPLYPNSVYSSDISHTHMATPAPPTPAPSVPPLLPEPPPTPLQHSGYYTNPFTPHYQDHYIDDRIHEQSYPDPIPGGEEIDIKPFQNHNYVQEYLSSQVPQTLESVDPLSVETPSPRAPPRVKKPKEPKLPRVPVTHQCHECEKIFKNSTQLKNHSWRHTGEKPFACDQCGSRFTQQGNLRAHRRIHTGERPYQCPECRTCFTQLSTLKTHQKIHSDDRPYRCHLCDAAFRQVANLKTHQVTHTGERPHSCDLCDKAFTQKSNLKAHKNRVHSTGGGVSSVARRGRRKNPAAIKPFSCNECGAKFTMMSNLRIHSKLHSGERPFECDVCGAGFAQRSNLKTHMHRMHSRGTTVGVISQGGRRKIHCDECPATFRLKRCLKTHKRKRHPIRSLKIKILRESQWLVQDREEDGEETDEEDDTDVGEEEDTREGSNYEPIVQISEPKAEPYDAPVSPNADPYDEEELIKEDDCVSQRPRDKYRSERRISGDSWQTRDVRADVWEVEQQDEQVRSSEESEIGESDELSTSA